MVVTDEGAKIATRSLIDKVVHFANVTGMLKVTTEKATAVKLRIASFDKIKTRRICHGNATRLCGLATLSRTE